VPHIDVVIPDNVISVLAESPAISVEVPGSFVSVVCDDVIASTYTEPTLTDWSVTVEDLELAGARFKAVELTTAGSPCRVRLSLVHVDASQVYRTRYSSPEQNTPHDAGVQYDISDADDRGLTYDLYWSWTSGNESGGPELVAAEAVYVPLSGEGDYPAEAE
jgi:hypothetical protein